MAKTDLPLAGETRKAWLLRVHGIGKGAGRGRISAEGHERLTEALASGYTFADLEAASVPKAPAVRRAPATAKVVLNSDARSEVAHVDPAAIREWAKENGRAVSTRGRIAAEVTLAYLAAVPVGEREKRGTDPNAFLDGAPRIHPEGTKFRLDFTNHQGEAETRVVNDRTACGNCKWSLAWCGCAKPYVTVGYNVGPIRVTALYPNGE